MGDLEREIKAAATKFPANGPAVISERIGERPDRLAEAFFEQRATGLDFRDQLVSRQAVHLQVLVTVTANLHTACA